MSNTTPVNGWTYQETTDSSNIETAVKTPLLLVDQRVNPIFATTAARATAIPSPSAGQEAYVTSTGEKYIYNGTSWVGMMPRSVFLTSDQTVTDSITPTAATQMVASLETSSRYTFHGYFWFSSVDASNSNDFLCSWSIPASSFGLWTPTAGNTTNASTTAANVYVVAQLMASGINFGTISGASQGINFHGYITTAGTAGNMQFLFSENTAIGGVTSVSLRSGSYIEILKVA